MKKFFNLLLVLVVLFSFVACDNGSTPTEPPVTQPPATQPPATETPAPVNNFKGNVFVAEYSVGSYSDYWGYIEFIDDTNGKMGQADYDEAWKPIPITEQPFTYSVTDDVATIKATMDGMQFTVTTSNLTDGRFTFSTEGVDTETGEPYSVLVTCTKGDKSLFDVWTVVYEEEELKEDFFYEFEDYVNVLDVEDDYELDTANKKIVLTENGHKKCCQLWTIVIIEDVVSEEEDYIENMLIFNMIGLNKTTDYTIDIDTLTIKVTESGMEKIEDATWTISYPAEGFEETSLEFMLVDFYEWFGLVDGDYTKDDAAKTITLTDSGWAKVQAAMGGEVTSEIVYDGNLVRTFESLGVADIFVSSIGLEEDVDYTIDDATKTITLLTEDSLEKVNAAWTVLDPEGNFLMAFPSLDAASAFATENGLDVNNDWTMDNGNQTITLTVAGWEKVSAGA